jgi:hypothetical protein
MKSTMSKEMVERERYGSRFKGEDTSRHERRTARQSLAIDGEDYDLGGPVRGIKAHAKGPKRDRKDLNENLNPLKRFLRSNVGRPWSKVYSEICEHIRLDSVVQRHILEHLDHMVEKNIRIINGKPYKFNGCSWSKDDHNNLDGWILCTNYKGSKSTLYVDPRDGILKFAPEIKKTQNTYWQNADAEWKDRQYRLESDPLTQYWKIDDIWYELKFRDATEDEISQRAFSQPCRVSLDFSEFAPSWWGTYDRFRYAFTVDFESVKRIFGRAMLPLSKRQLNTKEARRVEEAKAKQLKSERIRSAA